MASFRCPRCQALMGAAVFHADGQKCELWTCYRCGEALDEVILENRRMKPAISVKVEIPQLEAGAIGTQALEASL